MAPITFIKTPINHNLTRILLGYACAYSSAFMGREIIFKEVSCRGCGGDKCRIIGKPAEE